MLKVSTILPSYLNYYIGAASNREEKLVRAVDSWLSQSYPEKELVLVADGCIKTEQIYLNKYTQDQRIIFLKTKKHSFFSGSIRQLGLENATGDLINYLDSDDYFLPFHIFNIVKGMGELDWVYFSDYINKELRNVSLIKGSAGTSSIAHKRSLDVSWTDCNGYGHDWMFIERLRQVSSNFAKIPDCGYVVCHYGSVDV